MREERKDWKTRELYSPLFIDKLDLKTDSNWLYSILKETSIVSKSELGNPVTDKDWNNVPNENMPIPWKCPIQSLNSRLQAFLSQVGNNTIILWKNLTGLEKQCASEERTQFLFKCKTGGLPTFQNPTWNPQSW